MSQLQEYIVCPTSHTEKGILYHLLGYDFTEKQIQSFLRRIIPGHNNCMICTYSLGGGYPQQVSMLYKELRTIKCHRLAYELFVEPIPHNAVVCHLCDVPRCVNPNHLVAGSVELNNHDMLAKGRHAAKQQIAVWRMEKQEIINKIAAEFKRGLTCRQIAKIVGVSPITVSRYIRKYI